MPAPVYSDPWFPSQRLWTAGLSTANSDLLYGYWEGWSEYYRSALRRVTSAVTNADLALLDGSPGEYLEGFYSATPTVPVLPDGGLAPGNDPYPQYATDAEVAAALTGLLSDADLTAALAPYATTASVTAALAGAVAGKVGKGELVFNLLDYGTAADATAAWTAALAVVPDGATIIAPAGTYSYTGTVVFTSRNDLVLQLGRSAHRIAASPTGTAASHGRIFQFPSTSKGIRLQGGRFIAPVGTPSASTLASAVLIGGQRCSVTGTVFDSIGLQWAIRIDGGGAHYNEIRGTYTTGSGITYSYAGASWSKCIRNTIINAPENALTGSGNGGVGVYNRGCTVEDNTILTPGRIAIEDWARTLNTLIRGNHIYSTPYMGISAVGGGPTIDGNVIVDPGSDAVNYTSRYGIETNGSAKTVNNTVRFPTVAAPATGIVINSAYAQLTEADGSLTAGQVLNNTIEGASIGIDATTVTGTRNALNIYGNTIADWLTRGIQLTNATEPGRVAGNLLRQSVPNTSGAIRYGIHCSAPGYTVGQNKLVYLASAGGGANADYSFKFGSSADVTYIGNEVDGGGITTPAVVVAKGGGAAPTGLLWLDNRLTNSATYDGTGLVSPIVRDPTTAGGGGGTTTTYVAQGVAGSVAQQVVTNTTAETTLATYTAPANPIVGASYRVTASGTYDRANAAGSLTLYARIGGVACGSAVLSAGSATTAQQWVFTGTAAFRTIGAAGTVMGDATAVFATAATANSRTSASAVDTTAAQPVTFSAVWAVADVGNVLRVERVTVEVVRA